MSKKVKLTENKLRSIIKEELEKLNESWNNQKVLNLYTKFVNAIEKEIQNAGKYDIKISKSQTDQWVKLSNNLYDFLLQIFN